MRLGVVLGGLAGALLAAWLLHSYGLVRILELLARAGWGGLAVVIAFHAVQMVFSAAAWRAITGPTAPRVGFGAFFTLRWIREGVNNLLPVAQIGGEFVASRLLRRRGLALVVAIAGTVADLTMEMLTQIVFTLLGLALLLRGIGGGAGSGAGGGIVSASVTGGLLLAVIVAAAFLGAQWLGLASLVERGLLRLGRSLGWAGTEQVEGLHKALIGCYRRPRRIAQAAACHMLSWLLGGIEVCLALHFLGHDVGIVAGLVIESIGQALKAIGFAVPGALGVQEGGFIVVCQLFGLSPEIAIALSLMKRLREVVLGVPGLIAWQRMEACAPRRRIAEMPS